MDPVQQSICIYQAILADVAKTYTPRGGGGISSIVQTSTTTFTVQIAQEARKDLLLNVRTEAEGLDEMVRNLLAIARIQEGALELRLDWVDLREIADRVISAARRRGAQQTFRGGIARRSAAVACRCYVD